MKRLMLAAAVAAALSAPAMAADCAKDYKDFWEKLDRSRFAKMSAEQIAGLAVERCAPTIPAWLGTSRRRKRSSRNCRTGIARGDRDQSTPIFRANCGCNRLCTVMKSSRRVARL